MNFYLNQKRHYSVIELDEMIPFEREILVSQISREINENKNKRQQSQMGMPH